MKKTLHRCGDLWLLGHEESRSFNKI